MITEITQQQSIDLITGTFNIGIVGEAKRIMKSKAYKDLFR